MPPAETPANRDPTAAIVLIGDELLSGKVDDENARFLLRELRTLGVAARRIEVIPDDLQEIATAVRGMAARYDHVFTSGGVGATHDDVTLAAVAQAFGLRIERRPELAALIERSMGADFVPRDLRMADIPEGAELDYGRGPHPGAWPVVVVRNVFVLPGVPIIFRRKFELIRERFRARPIHSRALYSALGEGHIADALDEVVAAFPEVAIGSYPHVEARDYRVKLTLDGRDADAVEAAARALADRLGNALVRRDDATALGKPENLG